jgi:hypothetical protein
MTPKRLIVALILWAIMPAAFLSAAYQTDSSTIKTDTVVLYDGGLGTTPDQQGFTYLAFGTLASQQFANGATILDTTADGSEQAGYFIRETQKLDRALGYKVRFTIQVEEENHANPHRAGFSMIILSDDLLGLELAFWENEIWAQEGGSGSDLFTHAEGVNFDTTAEWVAYELSILDEAYTLSANDVPILTGSLRDYRAFEGFPDVYETPGLFFLGDDTSSAAAKLIVSYAALEIQSEAAPSASPQPTVTVTPTVLPPPTSTTTPTATPQPTVTATPRPANKLYIWLPCLKGVDANE